MEWGNQDGKWIPLEPIATHDDLDRSFVDEDGVLRADHRDRCRGKSVNITRLDKKVKAQEVLPTTKPKAKKSRRRAA
jgi:hypothetical protein